MRWKKLHRRDLPQTLAMLRRQEWRAVPLTARLCREGRPALPLPLEASLYACRAPQPCAVRPSQPTAVHPNGRTACSGERVKIQILLPSASSDFARARPIRPVPPVMSTFILIPRIRFQRLSKQAV